MGRFPYTAVMYSRLLASCGHSRRCVFGSHPGSDEPSPIGWTWWKWECPKRSKKTGRDMPLSRPGILTPRLLDKVASTELLVEPFGKSLDGFTD